MRVSRALAGTLFGVIVASNSSAAVAGPVQIHSQERRVTATGRPGNFADQVVDVRSAPDAGAFDDTAEVDASGGGFVARATAKLVSTLGDDGLRFAGTLAWETQDTRPGFDASGLSATAQSEVFANVIFSLDRAYDYSFTSALNVTDPAREESSSGDALLTFGDELIRPSGGEGTLQAGTYTLLFALSSTYIWSRSELDTFALDYDVQLDLTASEDNGGGGNPIPLPPTAWAGLGTMAMAALTRLRHARVAGTRTLSTGRRAAQPCVRRRTRPAAQGARGAA